jgi:hypothetical protein
MRLSSIYGLHGDDAKHQRLTKTTSGIFQLLLSGTGGTDASWRSDTVKKREGERKDKEGRMAL